MLPVPYLAGSSTIPSPSVLQQLENDDFRNGLVADQVRTRVALMIRALRELRGWSQAELGRRLGKPQSVISRLEDPDYGKLSLQTLFEVAAVFKLPLFIDMPDWSHWFYLMSDMSSQNLYRYPYDAEKLQAMRYQPLRVNVQLAPTFGSQQSMGQINSAFPTIAGRQGFTNVYMETSAMVAAPSDKSASAITGQTMVPVAGRVIQEAVFFPPLSLVEAR